MLIHIVDKNGVVGHPTTQSGYVRRKFQQGQAKLIKGNLTKDEPVTVQILDLEIDPAKTVEAKFRVGIDPGYEHIGFCVIKETVREVKVLYSGELKLRTSDITKGMQERAMYRNNRRRNRRLKARRRAARVGIPPRFRHPRWKNRRSDRKYTPTVQYVIQMHQNLLWKVSRFLPKDQVEVHFEVFSYDSQKIANPGIKNWEYSKGPQSGYGNVKAYVLSRDNHKCQHCKGKSKSNMLHVHHIIFRSQGGTNAPSNLITLCKVCHDKLHAGLISVGKSTSKQKAASVLNTAVPSIADSIKNAGYKFIPTFGYITKEVRESYSIEKTHSNDAMVISLCDDDWMQNVAVEKLDADGFEYELVSRRRHNRAVTNQYVDRKYGIVVGKYANGRARLKTVAWNRAVREGQDVKKKPSLEQYRINNPTHNLVPSIGGSISKRHMRKDNPIPIKFAPGDVVVYNDSQTKDEVFSVKGWASTQGKVHSDWEEYPTRGCRKILSNSGICRVI